MMTRRQWYSGHYTVAYHEQGWRAGTVRAILCVHCPHYEVPSLYKHGTDRSGLAKYGRARMAMIRHIRRAHPEVMPEHLREARA